jgi:GntR family transcriptional repressor for pyruvate dehydrogenase complex
MATIDLKGQLPGPQKQSRRGVKLAEQVAQEILNDITRKGLTPGDRLPSELIMAQGYGISRSSLREALRILEVHGLITIKSGPGGGPEIAEVGSADFARMATLFFQSTGVTFRQLLEARCILEPMIASMAAERRRPADIIALNDNVQGARETEDIVSLNDFSHEFHAILSRIAGNQVLGFFVTSLHGIFQIYSRDTYTARSIADIIATHTQIASAVEHGNSDEAAKVMRQHMEGSAAHFRKQHPGLLDSAVSWMIT